MKNLTRKKYLITTSLLALALITSQSFANEEILSSSNISDFTYPNHSCMSKPAKPVKPKDLTSDNDVKRYNREISEYNIDVGDYNEDIKLYKKCINQYIKNGNRDINTIRQRLNNALEEARSNKL